LKNFAANLAEIVLTIKQKAGDEEGASNILKVKTYTPDEPDRKKQCHGSTRKRTEAVIHKNNSLSCASA